MKGYKRIIEKDEISDMLNHMISISTDQERIFLNVEYDGRFTIEKMFKNNSLGLMDLHLTREKLDSEEKVLKYFNIGE
jgi:hypothetical protein